MFLIFILLLQQFILSKRTTIYTITPQLHLDKETFMTKMYIQSNGIVKIKVSTDRNQHNHKFKIFAYQEEDYYSKMASITDLKKKQTHIVNKKQIKINEENILFLKQKSPHLWFFTLASLHQKPDLQNGQRAIIQLQILNNNNHLEYYERQLMIIQLIKLLTIIVYFQIKKPFYNIVPNFVTISLFLIYIFQIIYSVLFFISFSIKSYSGECSKILLAIQQIPNISIANIIIFIHILILLGWRILDNREDYLDIVSPFVICKATLQIILFIMYLRATEQPDIFIYEQSFYYSIQCGIYVLFFLVGTASLVMLKNYDVMHNHKIEVIYWTNSVYMIILPILKIYFGTYYLIIRLLEIIIEFFTVSFIFRHFHGQRIKAKKYL